MLVKFRKAIVSWQLLGLWLLCSPNWLAALDVEFAQHNDFSNLMLLNRDVSREFFLPLFQSKPYKCSKLSDNPSQWLYQEVLEDSWRFRQAIDKRRGNRLLVARTSDGHMVGLLLYHFAGEQAILDLFMVHRSMRRQGVGRALVKAALDSATTQHEQPVKKWGVWALRYNNDDTLKFYNKMGFKPSKAPQPEACNRVGEPLVKTHCFLMLNVQPPRPADKTSMSFKDRFWAMLQPVKRSHGHVSGKRHPMARSRMHKPAPAQKRWWHKFWKPKHPWAELFSREKQAVPALWSSRRGVRPWGTENMLEQLPTAPFPGSMQRS